MSGRVGRRKPVARRDSSFRSIALLLLIPLVALALYVAFRFVRDRILSPSPEPVRQSALWHVPPVVASVPPSAPNDTPTPVRGSIVLILDDVGFDRQPVERAMQIDPNLDFSILPNARNAREYAELLHGKGFEIICHLPMEPVDYPAHSPGPHAVMLAMTDEEIVRTTRDDIAAVPHASGVNNHMGSAATADSRVMRSVLSAIPPGLFFVDSMTTGGSIAGRMAREMKIPSAERRVFLDDIQSEREVRRQLTRLTAEAAERGVAVGIGHMYPVTVKVLSEDVPGLRRRGIRVIRASEAVN